MSHVIDDFAHTTAAHATRWSVLTDQVMGGVSTGRVALEPVRERRALRLQGTVSLEHRGGFLQMVRHFGGTTSASLDASAFTGLDLAVVGVPGTYFVHLRSADTLAPWQYYSARLPVTTEWTDVRIDWNAFAPQALRVKLDVSRLVRVGIVAAQAAFAADVAVARLAFASPS